MSVVLPLPSCKVIKKKIKKYLRNPIIEKQLQIYTMLCVRCFCSVFLLQPIGNPRKNFKQDFVCLRCKDHVKHYHKGYKNTVFVQKSQNYKCKSKKNRKIIKSVKHKIAKKVKKKYLPQNILDDINWMIACYKSTL